MTTPPRTDLLALTPDTLEASPRDVEVRTQLARARLKAGEDGAALEAITDLVRLEGPGRTAGFAVIRAHGEYLLREDRGVATRAADWYRTALRAIRLLSAANQNSGSTTSKNARYRPVLTRELSRGTKPAVSTQPNSALPQRLEHRSRREEFRQNHRLIASRLPDHIERNR